jgi:hypothetical protein
MLRLLSGLLHYELENEYPVRFWKAERQLILLDRAIDEGELRVDALRRITERTDLEFDLFQSRITGQLDRILNMRNEVTELLKRQEQYINQLAIADIRRQQRHILQLRLNARFELAKIYDKMTADK